MRDLPKSLWELKPTETFAKLYRSKDDEMKKKAREVMDELAVSKNPYHGAEKIGPTFWTVRLSKDDRLAYFVQDRMIWLLKVCSHKDVYGR